jgi:hypothetical protein
MHADDAPGRSVWKVGTTDFYEILGSGSTSGKAILFHIATPIRSLSALHLDQHEEDVLLSKAWNLASSCMPESVVGRRYSWRSLIYLLDLEDADPIMFARKVLAAFLTDEDLNRVPWHLTLSPVGSRWQDAVRLVEGEVSEAKNIQRSMILWVEGDFKQPVRRLVDPR